MSFIAGSFYFGTKPESDERAVLLVRMRKVMMHRGSDDWACCSSEAGDFVVGGYAWGTQDCCDSSDGCPAVAWDGRLDNLDEMRRELSTEHVTPARLVALAYHRWGSDVVLHIEGEFAFVILAGNSLLLARDASGSRPLFYARTQTRMLFGSEIKSLFQDHALIPKPNRGMAADLLWGSFPRNNETFFEGVYRLAPGHILQMAGNGSANLCAYHPIARRMAIRRGDYATTADVRVRIREDLTEAVKRRIQRPQPCGLLLSGGIDSPSVLSVCGEAFRRANRSAHEIHIFSSYFGRITSCDERPLVEAIAQMYDCKPTYIRSDDFWALRDVDAAPKIRLDEPLRGQLVDRFEVAQVAAARDAGVRLLLTGYGGDEVLTGSLWSLRDLYAKGSKEQADLEYDNLPPLRQEMAREILESGLSPLSSAKVQPPFDQLPRELNELHLQRIQERDIPQPNEFESLAAWDEYRRATGFGRIALGEVARGVALQYGVEMLMPFLDSRIIETSISIPGKYKLHGGFIKNLGRILLEGHAPAVVLDRKVKSDLNGLVDLGLRFRERKRIEELIRTRCLADMGLPTFEFAQEVYARYRRGEWVHRTTLLRVLALNLWALEWFGRQEDRS